MPDFFRNISRALLILLCLVSFSMSVTSAESPVQPTERHFQEEQLEKYRQDNEFRYDYNPYRQNTIWEKVKYYLYQLFKKAFSDSGAAPYIRSLVILAIIIFAVIKLSEGQFQWFLGKDNKDRTGNVVLPGEEISRIDLQALADKAMQDGDLRLCIRYHYLHILKELDKKAYISWHKDKTNRDYLREIQSADIRSQFKIQTLVFDYVWYGKFQLSNDQFQAVQSGFLNLISSIQNAKKEGTDER